MLNYPKLISRTRQINFC